MKWPNALATVTPRLVKDNCEAPVPRIFRTMLYSWAFLLVLGQASELVSRVDAEEAPEHIVAAPRLDRTQGRGNIDFRYCPAPALARTLIGAVGKQGAAGAT
ncbi:hypothetical protein [Streptomyces griseus]|uniref:hypothetical protein n=1 Tax=Streptomyces griseus TaxID=1911 RepID=UPI0036B12008